MTINTTRSLYGMHEEQYASKHGPAKITSDGKKVEWAFDHGGQQFYGSEVVDEHGEQAALHRARKAVDEFALSMATRRSPDPAATVEAEQAEQTEPVKEPTE